jgi:DNA-directed RNA polymerase specialized sigma24 family protein
VSTSKSPRIYNVEDARGMLAERESMPTRSRRRSTGKFVERLRQSGEASVTTDTIWTAFSGRLRGFIAKRVREDVDIDDILQDVFAKIHAELGKLKEDERLEAWLFQITRRAIADHYRKRRSVALQDEVAERPAPEDISAKSPPGWTR